MHPNPHCQDTNPKHIVVCVEADLSANPNTITVRSKLDHEVHWRAHDGAMKFRIVPTEPDKFEKHNDNGTSHSWVKPKKNAKRGPTNYTIESDGKTADPVIIIDDTQP